MSARTYKIIEEKTLADISAGVKVDRMNIYMALSRGLDAEFSKFLMVFLIYFNQKHPDVLKPKLLTQIPERVQRITDGKREEGLVLYPGRASTPELIAIQNVLEYVRRVSEGIPEFMLDIN